jgi:hypothetical protein
MSEFPQISDTYLAAVGLTVAALALLVIGWLLLRSARAHRDVAVQDAKFFELMDERRSSAPKEESALGNG